jgi:hypothetical protein
LRDERKNFASLNYRITGLRGMAQTDSDFGSRKSFNAESAENAEEEIKLLGRVVEPDTWIFFD